MTSPVGDRPSYHLSWYFHLSIPTFYDIIIPEKEIYYELYDRQTVWTTYCLGRI